MIHYPVPEIGICFPEHLDECIECGEKVYFVDLRNPAACLNPDCKYCYHIGQSQID